VPVQRVIISVAVEGGPHGLDLEVPAGLPAAELVPLLAAALQAPAHSYRLEALPPGRLLQPHESLAAAGAWDGAWLILRVADS
jgi:hypothetical protein